MAGPLSYAEAMKLRKAMRSVPAQAGLLVAVTILALGCVKPPKRRDILDTRSLEEKLFYDVPNDYYTREYVENELLFMGRDDCQDR